jgi:hypothetical protein
MRLSPTQQTPSPSSKEPTSMKKHIIIVSSLVLAAIAALALPSAAASAASPWWQILTGSRPTNLWEPSNNVQEIRTEESAGFFAAKIEVEGDVIGCLATGSLFGFLSADEACQLFAGVPEATENAEEL